MRTVVLVLFSIAWAAVAFAVIRAVVVAWGYHRRLATATAFAVAGAFALGSVSPFSVAQRVAGSAPGPAAAPAGVPHAIACPTSAKLVASPGQGHIDSLSVGGVSADIAKPVELARDAVTRVGGWVVGTSGLATGLCILVDGRPVAFDGVYGVDRPDVAAALNKPEDRAAGFDVTVRLPAGSHVLTVGPTQSDGSLTPVAQPISVRVR